MLREPRQDEEAGNVLHNSETHSRVGCLGDVIWFLKFPATGIELSCTTIELGHAKWANCSHVKSGQSGPTKDDLCSRTHLQELVRKDVRR